MTEHDRYTLPAVALHWLMAILIFAGAALGTYMVSLAISPFKLKLYSWHKWIGVTVILLAIARVIWRLKHPPPPEPAMPQWQAVAAMWTHRLLYVLMFAVPISGWLFSSATGFKTVYFGVLPIPDLLEKNKPLSEVLKLVHLSLVYGLFGLVALHIGAALKHTFVDRDGLMRRMLPKFSRSHSQ